MDIRRVASKGPGSSVTIRPSVLYDWFPFLTPGAKRGGPLHEVGVLRRGRQQDGASGRLRIELSGVNQPADQTRVAQGAIEVEQVVRRLRGQQPPLLRSARRPAIAGRDVYCDAALRLIGGTMPSSR